MNANISILYGEKGNHVIEQAGCSAEPHDSLSINITPALLQHTQYYCRLFPTVVFFIQSCVGLPPFAAEQQ